MESKIPLLLLILTVLVSSCAPAAAVTTEPAQAAASATVLPSLPAPEATGLPATDAPTAAPTCASEDVRKLAQAIAADYAFTNTDEILTWFCSGAEIEDIMVALQTEELTTVPAEDMLKMRAEGLTWEEIWQVVGLDQ